MRPWVVALGMIVCFPAHADMYQDASNAKLTEASRNLGVGWYVPAGQDVQASLTAAQAAGGGTVRLGPGQHTVNGQSLLIGSNTRVICDKGAVIYTTKTPAWPGSPYAYAAFQNLNNTATTKLDHNIAIEGCTFRADADLGSLPQYKNIYFQQFRNASIRNNVFNGGGAGSALIGGDSYVVEGNTNGVVLNGQVHSNTTVDGLPCTAECGVYVGSGVASIQAGWPIYPTYTWVTAINSDTSVTVSNPATLTGPARIGFNQTVGACYDNWDAPQNVSIANNRCVSGNAGITITGFGTNAPGGKANGIAIIGNHIDMVGIPLTGIDLTGEGAAGSGSGVHNAVVSGNTIAGDSGTGFACFFVSGETRDAVFANNKCGPGGIGGPGPAGSWAVRQEADASGEPSHNLYIGNIFDDINVVAAASVALMQLSGVNTTAIGNVVIGGSYKSLIWAPSAGAVLIGNRGPNGTLGAASRIAAAADAVIQDVLPTSFQRFMPGLVSRQIQIEPIDASTLPTCAAPLAGTMQAVSNAGSAVFNAPIACCGAIPVVAYCNGTAWVVH